MTDKIDIAEQQRETFRKQREALERSTADYEAARMDKGIHAVK